ncbi:glycosyltransferase family 2 protein [Nocardioides campestrisoli]|uniref:glycosyltransferase family 2 protein n=1 Tax=Nocardioides campestrisoli TaxID=2736757 RepID=UPI00163D9824|nr:glycosyltransferase family 2 protein [Nocardioides campestrisoli]
MTVDGRPLVSLVIPTYQSVGQLSTTLESALSQTYPRIEICVSDHASTDGTWQLLQSYRDRVALRRITAGGGAQRNWNAATEMASGELVKLLCADDLVTPDCVERQVAALEEHPSAALVSAKRRLIGRSGVVLLEQRGLGPLTGLQDGLTAVGTLVRSGSNLLGEPGTVLFRRAALVEAGAWSTHYPYLIDQHAYMRVLEGHDMVGVDEVLASFRVTRGQWSVRLASVQAAQARALHREYRDRHPGTVRRRDLACGDVRATTASAVRRMAYVAWRRHM